jgi:hypothetical protein
MINNLTSVRTDFNSTVDPAEYNKAVARWAQLSLGHLVPFIAVNIDLSMSSIMFYPNHAVIILIVSILYLGYHLFKFYYINGPNVKPLYPSHDWYQEPVLATIYTVIVIGFIIAVFFL